ncbi:MAG: acyl-CoA thioesterase [Planctomycetes bacterium]|nr:acyl-CoA thioesterase [Planctomycetota bacterium]
MIQQPERTLSIRVTMLPKDTNGMGTIFGGIILSYIALAGGVEARRTARHLFVTRAMKQVEFLAPVFVGDTVSFWTRTIRVGSTSITVAVEVEVERLRSGDVVPVTSAEVTYVAVDDDRRPVAIASPASKG